MKKRFFFVFLILSIIIVGVSFFLKNYQTNDLEENQKSLFVKKGRFIYSIDLIGEIEAKKQIYLASSSGRAPKIEMIADDGKIVKKGEVIVKLESKDDEERLVTTEMDLGISQNELNLLEQNFSADLVKYTSAITLAEKDVQLKKLELKKVLDGATKEELEKLHLDMELAKKAVKLAKENLEQSNRLFQKGIVQKKDILEKELELAQKEKNFEMSKAEYILTKAGSTETTKQIARLELQQAKNKLAIEQKNKEFELKKYQLQKEKKKVRIEGNLATVNQLKTRVSCSLIKAPVAGTAVLSKIWTDQGLAKPKVGDTIERGMPFISVANLDDFLIKTEIEEQHIGQIKKDLPCSITMSTLKGKKFKGKISKIGVFAKERGTIFQQYSNYKEGQSKVFELDIELLEKDSLFKPGMSVDVQILLKDLKNVIVIPNKAIYKELSKNYVILENNEKRYIELSETNQKESVVKSGLNIGEKIIIQNDEVEGETI